MTHNYRARIQKVLATLKTSGTHQALVVSSNPSAIKSADQHHTYRANSDLFYLTGITAPDVTLVVRTSESPNVIIVAPTKDPVRILWEGPQPSLKGFATKAGATLLLSKDVRKSVRELLRGTEVVYTQGFTGTVSASVRSEISRLTGEAPKNSPHTVGSAETFLAPLRLVKSASEIAAIREAGEVTGEVLHAVLPLLEPGSSEREVGALIDYYYRLCGGCPGFETIVAAGPSAATLHYHTLTRSIKDGDMVLIDTGIELGLYNADITRTIPVGTISEAQGVMYDSVLRAQYAAIKKVKHNALIRDIYLAAAKELTIGLKEVGILKGQLSTLVSKGAYKPYFPHGIGHSLGIDVHDVGGLRGNQEARLQKGMVFTIEPGLYLPKATKHLPACGVRIEDDVVVTASGCINLTEKVFPKEREAMARTMAR